MDTQDESNSKQSESPKQGPSNMMMIIVVLAVGALIAFVIYSSNKDHQDALETQQQQMSMQQAQLEEAAAMAQQSAQEQKEALAVAEKELSEKEAILAEGTAVLANQSCENALETAKTQKAVLTKEIDDLTAIGKKINNNPSYATDICRHLNPGLSRPECETKIENGANEAKESIVAMEAKIEELDERITTGCSTSQTPDAPTE